MNEFSSRIKTASGFFPEFFFHRMFTVSGQRYHVSVKDREGRTIFFNMGYKGNHGWKIVDAPKVPGWIMEIEPALNEAILESMVT